MSIALHNTTQLVILVHQLSSNGNTMVRLNPGETNAILALSRVNSTVTLVATTQTTTPSNQINVVCGDCVQVSMESAGRLFLSLCNTGSSYLSAVPVRNDPYNPTYASSNAAYGQYQQSSSGSITPAYNTSILPAMSSLGPNLTIAPISHLMNNASANNQGQLTYNDLFLQSTPPQQQSAYANNNAYASAYTPTTCYSSASNNSNLGSSANNARCGGYYGQLQTGTFPHQAQTYYH